MIGSIIASLNNRLPLVELQVRLSWIIQLENHGSHLPFFTIVLWPSTVVAIKPAATTFYNCNKAL